MPRINKYKEQQYNKEQQYIHVQIIIRAKIILHEIIMYIQARDILQNFLIGLHTLSMTSNQSSVNMI